MSKSTFIPTDEQRESFFDYYSDLKKTCEAMLGDGFDKQYIKGLLNTVSETL